MQITVFSRVYYGSIWLKIAYALQHVVKLSRIEFKNPRQASVVVASVRTEL
jgi:hypothetical protein